MNIDNFYLDFKGHKYPVLSPTPKSIIEISRLQSLIAAGQYGNLVLNRTPESEFSLDAIDMQCHFTIMVPSMAKALQNESKSFLELNITDFNQCRQVFRDQYWPWWKTVREVMGLTPKQADEQELIEKKEDEPQG